MSDMNIESIKEKLDEQLEDIPWAYTVRERESSLELRNKGTNLSSEDLDKKAKELIESIEKDSHKTLLEGKCCVGRSEDGYWIDDLDREGELKGSRDPIDEEELENLVKKSIERVDGVLVPTNRVHLSLDQISGIYSEDVRDKRFVTISIGNNKSITLRDDGGLQFRGVAKGSG